MTTKNYLNRAYNLERVVNNKLTELSTLQTIAEKVTASFSDIPQSGTRNVHRHEEVMAKIIDLQNEISGDVANLIDIKRETMNIIKTVENVVYRMILEERYLCYKSWEEIAIDLKYSVPHIYRLHRKALSVIKIQKDDSKCSKMIVDDSSNI